MTPTDGHMAAGTEERTEGMARYERKCDVWVRALDGKAIAWEVGAYHAPNGMLAWRDETVPEWHLAESFTGIDCGQTFRTRREADAWAEALDPVELAHDRALPKAERWHRELMAMAEESERLADEWKAEGRRRQAERDLLPEPEPVEVVEEVPAEAYADVDAKARPKARREDPRKVVFLSTFSGHMDWLAEHDSEDSRFLRMTLAYAGKRWSVEHPRMFRKVCGWYGNPMRTERELAALSMWVENSLSVERELSKSVA